MKVGVGAKPKGWDLADYVLGRFSPQERELVDQAIIQAADAVEMILSEGIEAAMNHYNGAAKKKKAKTQKSENSGRAGEPAGVSYAGIYAAIGKFNRVPGDPFKAPKKPGSSSDVRLCGIPESPYDVWAFSWYGKRRRERRSELPDHCGK